MNSLNSTGNTITKKSGCGSKTITNMSFFLDNKNSPQLNATLTEKIFKLGAKIDPFITKDTDWVVTSRPRIEWNQPAKIQNGSPSPFLFLNNISGFSRGKMLLEKSGHTYKTMDTLELANHFKVSILKSTRLMKFLDECLEKRARCANNLQTTTNVKQQSSDDSVRRLLPPFIKVVDNSFKYRPNFKELNQWPSLNFEFQPELCPFYKAKGKAADNNESSHQQQQVYKNINQFSQESNKTNNGLKQCAMLTTPILTTTTNTPNVNNKSVTTVNQNRNNNLRRKHLNYCEICRRDFVDFEAHLKDEQHANFLTDGENYRELIGVINSLPPFLNERMSQETQTNEINLYGSNVGSLGFNNHLQPQTSYNNQTNWFDNNANLWFKTQSSPMTSVQLTNSKSSTPKLMFLAIHDLDMSDENNINRNNLPESA